MSIEALRDELDELLDIAKKLVINHHKIAEKLQYSYIYIAKIRSKERCNNDTKDNRDLLFNIIAAYRKEIGLKLNELNVNYKEIKG